MAFTQLLLLAAWICASARSESTVDIDVGEDGLVFNPSSVTAAPGDTIEFTFYPGAHSVARSDYDNPCQSSQSNQIWSGFITNDNTKFSIVVNDTDPIWLYCAQVGHCAGGMSMVINPP
jgi:plastocyanin